MSGSGSKHKVDNSKTEENERKTKKPKKAVKEEGNKSRSTTRTIENPYELTQKTINEDCIIIECIDKSFYVISTKMSCNYLISQLMNRQGPEKLVLKLNYESFIVEEFIKIKNNSKEFCFGFLLSETILKIHDLIMFLNVNGDLDEILKRSSELVCEFPTIEKKFDKEELLKKETFDKYPIIHEILFKRLSDSNQLTFMDIMNFILQFDNELQVHPKFSDLLKKIYNKNSKDEKCSELKYNLTIGKLLEKKFHLIAKEINWCVQELPEIKDPNNFSFEIIQMYCVPTFERIVNKIDSNICILVYINDVMNGRFNIQYQEEFFKKLFDKHCESHWVKPFLINIETWKKIKETRIVYERLREEFRKGLIIKIESEEKKGEYKMYFPGIYDGLKTPAIDTIDINEFFLILDKINLSRDNFAEFLGMGLQKFRGAVFGSRLTTMLMRFVSRDSSLFNAYVRNCL